MSTTPDTAGSKGYELVVGMGVGLVAPLACFVVLAVLSRYVLTVLIPGGVAFRLRTVVALSICVNLLPAHWYVRQDRLWRLRGLVLITVLEVIAFFVFYYWGPREMLLPVG